jgi:hypothetical protein
MHPRGAQKGHYDQKVGAVHRGKLHLGIRNLKLLSYKLGELLIYFGKSSSETNEGLRESKIQNLGCV